MRARPLVLPILFLALATAGCGTASPPVEAERVEPARAVAPDRPANQPRVVFLGDSLTAGLGLPEDQSYPALIQQRIDEAGLGFTVVNAGVSGDTSAGGLRRLAWSIEGDARVLVVALGANDGLRGLPPAEMQRNLAAIIERARGAGLRVILAGMEAPPNIGPEYTAAFRRVYTDLAREHDVPLIPFLLQDVAGVASLNQADGIHPNARGAAIMADTVWRTLGPVLTAVSREEP
ncbi:MAG: arylesterase [Acidobacteriota bacterium]